MGPNKGRFEAFSPVTEFLRIARPYGTARPCIEFPLRRLSRCLARHADPAQPGRWIQSATGLPCSSPRRLAQRARRLESIRDRGVIAASGKTISGAFPKSFVAAIAQHRFAEGPDLDAIVA